ncbi:MAG: rhomboid family intramembrane serine protease [Candidatus Pseudobacter hemicellulosilyticus]|uniref:Rhomboid family intramembrane serine protease n=1 Tax=Candidatus Pseudobacter hemicellulosilyticus TaxID=3121375 RepID=A0AAJ5WV06_9BACT|nr:MAG: rhomboid family intramembrane serine protease [Pseudobacter sp.]
MLRENRYKRKILLGQDGNSLMLLLAILAIVFCLFKFMMVVYDMSDWGKAAYYTNILDWFRMPADLGKLGSRPWTPFTYMFIHDGVFHMLGNVIWLWAFGYIMQDLTGNGKIIPLFIYGGLAGAAFFLISYNLFPKLAPVAPFASLEGASAGVMAIVIATTTLAPNYRIFPMIYGGIPLWVLTLIFVVIDFAQIPVSNTGGHLAHLAGAAIGFVYVKQLQRGRDWAAWMTDFFSWVGNLFNPDKHNWKKTARQELHYNARGTTPFKKVPNITQKRIDEILDKINQQGYRYLTEEEKEILKRAAEDEEL